MLRWLQRRAENIAALMLAVMFAAFVVQIVFRYFLNFPVGWTSELTVVMWLWIVLWGASFVLKENEEVRFDLITASVGRRARIAMGLAASVTLVILYGASLVPSWKYVTFMAVEKSSYLKVRMDWMFSIYILFLVAILARYLWIVWHLVRGREPEEADISAKAGSGL
jgi:C4-dicarboxylate transporter, DctQ subunit